MPVEAHFLQDFTSRRPLKRQGAKIVSAIHDIDVVKTN